jgi:hypothetical protein
MTNESAHGISSYAISHFTRVSLCQTFPKQESLRFPSTGLSSQLLISNNKAKTVTLCPPDI